MNELVDLPLVRKGRSGEVLRTEDQVKELIGDFVKVAFWCQLLSDHLHQRDSETVVDVLYDFDVIFESVSRDFNLIQVDEETIQWHVELVEFGQSQNPDLTAKLLDPEGEAVDSFNQQFE